MKVGSISGSSKIRLHHKTYLMVPALLTRVSRRTISARLNWSNTAWQGWEEEETMKVDQTLNLEEWVMIVLKMRRRKEKTVYFHLDFKFTQKKMPKIPIFNLIMIVLGVSYQRDKKSR